MKTFNLLVLFLLPAVCTAAWSAWSALTLPDPTTGRPTVINIDSNRLAVFAIGKTADVYWNYHQPGNRAWSGWINLGGGCVNGTVAATKMWNNPDLLEIFVRDCSGKVIHAWQTGPSSWSGWYYIGEPNQGNCIQSGSPSVTLRSNGRYALAISGCGNNLNVNQQQNNGDWGGWSSVNNDFPEDREPDIEYVGIGQTTVLTGLQAYTGAARIWYQSLLSGTDWKVNQYVGTYGSGFLVSPVIAKNASSGGIYSADFWTMNGDRQLVKFSSWNLYPIQSWTFPNTFSYFPPVICYRNNGAYFVLMSGMSGEITLLNPLTGTTESLSLLQYGGPAVGYLDNDKWEIFARFNGGELRHKWEI